MDPVRFDQLAKTLSATGTRRALLSLLTALPIAGGVAALPGEQSAARGRREKRKDRHKQKQDKRETDRSQEQNEREQQKRKEEADLGPRLSAGGCSPDLCRQVRHRPEQLRPECELPRLPSDHVVYGNTGHDRPQRHARADRGAELDDEQRRLLHH